MGPQGLNERVSLGASSQHTLGLDTWEILREVAWPSSQVHILGSLLLFPAFLIIKKNYIYIYSELVVQVTCFSDSCRRTEGPQA